MGMITSFMGERGMSTSQVLNLVMDRLYKQFVEKDIKEFDAFNVAILHTFSTINMALPGKHYDAPSYDDVKEFFKQWKEASAEARKKMFSDFMNKNVNLNKVNESMIVTAIVAPPAAMVAKRTGQTVPHLKFMNAIPDVVFVPSATVLALISVKILRLMFMGNTTTSKGATAGSRVDNVVQQSSTNNNIPPPTPTPPPEPETSLQHSQQHKPTPTPPPPPPPAPETSSQYSHQNTPKGIFCALCNKVHD